MDAGVRQFLSELALFLAPLVLVFVSIEVGFRRAPNLYADKMAILERSPVNLNAVILGNSHAYYGIDPSAFSVPTINLALPSQTFRYDRFILERTLAIRPSVRVVILNISAFAFGIELHRGPEKWRCRFYSLYWDYPGDSLPWATRFSPLSLAVGLNGAMHAIRRSITCTSCVDHDRLGFLRSPPNAVESIDVSGSERAGLHGSLYLPSSEQQNIEDIGAIADLVDSRNGRLYLVRLPTSERYLAEMANSHAEAVSDGICSLLEAERPNVECVRYDIRDLPADAFHDGDHLSGIGAEVVSAVLARRVKSWTNSQR